jgi:hypothetical protein
LTIASSAPNGCRRKFPVAWQIVAQLIDYAAIN